jgi:hypothetical protein
MKKANFVIHQSLFLVHYSETRKDSGSGIAKLL